MAQQEGLMIREINILIVDDDQGTCKVIANTLTECGYKVTTAFTGEEAIEKARKQTFDILITDLKLPGIDGIEVLKKIKEGNIDICAIMITAYASVDTAIKALEEGAYDYITKPFDMEEIKFVVNKGLERMSEYERGEIDEFKVPVLDVLTQVYTRKYFYRVLNREINRTQRYNQPMSLLLIGIDNFSEYNQRYGSHIGNEALKKIAQLFSKVTRQVDFLFRYTESEFALLLPETNKDGGLIVAKRLKNIVEQTKFQEIEDSTKTQLTISIGFSTYPLNAVSKDELLCRATEALYQAKQLGKNRICSFQDGGIKELN